VVFGGTGGYRGEDAVGQYTIDGIPALLGQTFMLPQLYFFQPDYMSYFPLYLQVVLWIGIAASVVLSIILMVRSNKKIGKWLTLLFAAVCLPVAMAFIQILNTGAPPHSLMIYAFIIPWIYMLQVNEQIYEIDRVEKRVKMALLKRAASILILITCVYMIVFGCYLANVAYLRLKVNYDTGLAVADRIVYRIENTPGYTSNTPVAIVGSPDLNSFGYWTGGGFDITYHIAGVYRTPFTYSYPLTMYITEETQTEMNLVYSYPYSTMPEVMTMESYPSQNCEKWIDKVLVIKLGDH
ncbi:MAG: hypothetical protein WCP73_10545, partial [Eubacteriales bacterium]